MITPEEIQKKAERKFPDFLKWKAAKILLRDSRHSEFISESVDTFSDFFPLEIKADKGKTSGNLSEREKEISALIEKSKQKTGRGYELLFQEVKTKSNGIQSAVKSIQFTTEEDFLSAVKKCAETKNLVDALEVLKSGLRFENSEKLYGWATHHFSDLTSSHEKDFWRGVCLCVNFLVQNPETQKYIRELPLQVHTKFIENNKSLIHSLTILNEEMLKQVHYDCHSENENCHSEKQNCHSEFISESHETTQQKLSFEKLHGLKEKPVLVRFRALSDDASLSFGSLKLSEILLPLEDFALLPKSGELSSIRKIFIVENEMVYLTFPKVKNSLCVWGHGFTAVELKNAAWFSDFELYYFGDLDEHGFLILSDFRKYFPRAVSFCMDFETLNQFGEFRVEGKTLAGNSIPENLTEEESQVFSELRKDKSKNRLEQERISNGWIIKKLESLK